MTTPPPLTPEMQTAFDNYPPPIRDQMLNVRKLAYEVAADTEGVGQLEETLKWRQISYLPSATKSGTTLRMDQDPANPSQVALYVHCQTNLIETFQGALRRFIQLRQQPWLALRSGKSAGVGGAQGVYPDGLYLSSG